MNNLLAINAFRYCQWKHILYLHDIWETLLYAIIEESHHDVSGERKKKAS